MCVLKLRFLSPISVALNFQTAGAEMDLYDGLFSQNGRCGYVLKPSFMRDTETNFSPENPQGIGDRNPLTLIIKVLYCELVLHG